MTSTPDDEMNAVFSATRQTLGPSDAVRERVYQATLAEFRKIPVALPIKIRRKPTLLTWTMAASVVFAAGLLISMFNASSTADRGAIEFTLTQGSILIDGAAHHAARPTGAVAGTSSTIAVASGAVITVPAEATCELVFGEGTLVRFRGGSDVILAGLDRLRIRRGALYVDNRDHTVRMLVETPFGTVTDVGTQFLVAVTPDALTVALREGRVEIDAMGVPPLEARVDHGAGALVHMTRGAGVRQSRLETTDAYWTWTRDAASPFELSGSTVDQFLHWTSRESGLELHYASDIVRTQARQTTLTGGDIGVPAPSQLAEILTDATQYQSRVEGNVLTVDFRR